MQQTLVDNNGDLRIEHRHQAVSFSKSAAFDGTKQCGKDFRNVSVPCALWGPSESIVKLVDGTYLASFYGFVDNCTATRCVLSANETGTTYSVAFFRSLGNGGMRWSYTSRIDATAAMARANPTQMEGPCEASMVVLGDGSVLVVFRVQSGAALWQAYSRDGARSWSEPTITTAWSVMPKLVRMLNGAVVLTSGRHGLGMWLSRNGSSWRHFDV